MKTLSFPVVYPAILFIFLVLPACGESSECSVETMTGQEISKDKINDNFQCIEKKLLAIDSKLNQILSRLDESTGTGEPKGGDETNQWSRTVGTTKIYITEARLKQSPKGNQAAIEWRIHNQSSKNLMALIVGSETSMRMTGDKAYRPEIVGLNSCPSPTRVCAQWDSSKWTIIPPGQIHGFSTLLSRRDLKMEPLSLNVNVQFVLNDQETTNPINISFSDIALLP